VFLKLNYQLNVLEVSYGRSVSVFPFQSIQKIARKKLNGIECGPTCDMFKGEDPECEIIILGLSILIKNRKPLNVLAPSKNVLINWIDGLESFILE